MTQKQIKEIIENVDEEHGWRLDHRDGYSERDWWFIDFDHATVVTEREAFYEPGYGSHPGRTSMGITHRYLFREGEGTDEKPWSYYRKTKTEVLNFLNEMERRK